MGNTQMRVFRMKLQEPATSKAEKLDESLSQFRGCVNLWIQKIAELGEYPNRGNAYKYAYHDVKEAFPELYSNAIQERMNRAIEIMRNKNGSLPEYAADSMSFKAVDVRYDGEHIGVPVTGKERIWLPLIVPQYFSKYVEYEKGRAQLIKKDSEFAEKALCRSAFRDLAARLVPMVRGWRALSRSLQFVRFAHEHVGGERPRRPRPFGVHQGAG